jgi:hypothetical protein
MSGWKHPATFLAALALFIALGSGAAVAGGLISGRQLVNHSVPESKLTRGAIAALRGHKVLPPTAAPGAASLPSLQTSTGANTADPVAQGSGLVAWTVDPALMATKIVDSSGSIHGASIWLDQGDTINWLAELVVTDGSGMTHGGFAIYDANLNLVAQTADTPTAFQTAPADSWVKLPLTSSYTAPSSGIYYLVDLLAGTTIPRIGIAASNSAVLTGASLLPTGVPRGVAQSGVSSFPSTMVTRRTGLTRIILAG